MRPITDKELADITRTLKRIDETTSIVARLDSINTIIKRLKKNEIDPTSLKEASQQINNRTVMIKQDTFPGLGATIREKQLYKLACNAEADFDAWTKTYARSASARKIYASSPYKLKQNGLSNFKSKLELFKDTDALMSLFVTDLIQLVDDLMLNKITREQFKASINTALDNEQARKLKEPNSPYYDIHYAITSVFRGLFRLFDLGWMIGRKTMNETYTPFAKTFTGNNHFFELPRKSTQEQMSRLTQEIENEIKNLDDLFVTTASPCV